MPTLGETHQSTDSRRDALKYHHLLLALQRATDEIRAIEEGLLDIDAVLDRLLPELTSAFGAERAFVVRLLDGGNGGAGRFELTAICPVCPLQSRSLRGAGLLGQIAEDGVPRIYAPLGGKAQGLIPGLEPLGATSAVLVCMRSADGVRIVGICNKLDPDDAPFLAADRMALANLIDLIAIGVRAGERRRRELESIQRLSAAIGEELDLDELLARIVDGAADAFGAPATSLMLLDDSGRHFVARASHGLSESYVQRQRIPRRAVMATAAALQGLRPLVIPDLQTQPFGEVALIREEGLCSVLAAPLVMGDRLIGLLNVYSRHVPRTFTSDEIEIARIFANQAAIAIHTAQQYRRLIQRRQQIAALERSMETISEAGLETEAMLQAILDQAVAVTDAHFGTLQLVEGDELVFVAAWPTDRLDWLREHVGRMPIDGPGITARAVRENDAQLVPDVRADPHYVDVTGRTGSELAAVLRQEGAPVGVLNVEHERVGGLDAVDRELLISLSMLVVIALQSAEQYELLLASEAVAWLGLFGANWQHAINQKTFSISNYAEGLRRWLQGRDAPPDIVEHVSRALARIEQVVEGIRSVQFIGQVPPEVPSPMDEYTVMDRELPAVVERWCAGRDDVAVTLDLQCPGVGVGIAAQWLRVAMEKLINNALKAMPGGGDLTVATRRTGSCVELTIRDTGLGLPEFAVPHFLKRRVPRPTGRSGTGMGALIARFVARSHGGDLKLVWSRPGEGTELLMTLPVASGDRDEEP